MPIGARCSCLLHFLGRTTQESWYINILHLEKPKDHQTLLFEVGGVPWTCQAFDLPGNLPGCSQEWLERERGPAKICEGLRIELHDRTARKAGAVLAALDR